METRPLTEIEEQIGDQIAGLFYANSTAPLSPQVAELTNRLERDAAALTIEQTMIRLRNEQAVRRNYLAPLLNLRGDNSSESKILATASLPTNDPGVVNQLAYFKAVTANLTRYDLERWQLEHQELLKSLLRQPKTIITQLGQSLRGFTEQFYSGGYFEHLELVSIPPALQEQLAKVGLRTEIDRRETIIQKAAFISYLSQVCTVINNLPAGLTEEDALRAISAVTFNFKEAIEVTPAV